MSAVDGGRSGTPDNVLRAINTQSEQIVPDDVDKLFYRAYRESFNTKYLAMFVKSMKRGVLMISLGEGLPMIINYPLGGDGSKIRFVMMPVMDDETVEGVDQGECVSPVDS